MAFASNRSLVLLKVSQQLAALHTTRARLVDPTTTTATTTTTTITHCIKCGHFLFNGRGQHRTVRKHNNTVLQRTCLTCGFRQHIPLERGNASLFPKRRTRTSHSPPVFPAVPAVPMSPPEKSSKQVADTTSSRAKTRRNKRSGLQDMLSRNRQNELKNQQKKCDEHSGLAAFLGGL